MGTCGENQTPLLLKCRWRSSRKDSAWFFDQKEEHKLQPAAFSEHDRIFHQRFGMFRNWSVWKQSMKIRISFEIWILRWCDLQVSESLIRRIPFWPNGILRRILHRILYRFLHCRIKYSAVRIKFSHQVENSAPNSVLDAKASAEFCNGRKISGAEFWTKVRICF
jgi:hypothetical protein